MDESLKKNIFSIPGYFLSSEVDDLSKKIEGSGIRGALGYACRSWHKHLVATTDRAADVVSALRRSREHKLLFWLGVLSALGAVDDDTRALNATVKWLTEVCLDLQLDFHVSRF